MNIPLIRFSHFKGKSYIVQLEDVEYLVSYETPVVARTEIGVFLDDRYWDYSKTTVTHVTNFLGISKPEIQARLATEEFKLISLGG